MATGYTLDLYEGKGVNFAEFAMKCARAFGFLVEMRDLPLDASIPDEFKLDDHHLNAIKIVEDQLAKVQKWSVKRAEKEAKKDFNDQVRSIQKYNEKKERISKSYIAMLEQVIEWVPPTKHHEQLKIFMIKQLVESLKFDCLHTLFIPRQLSGKQYRARLIRNFRQQIKGHVKDYNAEARWAQKKNKWTHALRRSLNNGK